MTAARPRTHLIASAGAHRAPASAMRVRTGMTFVLAFVLLSTSSATTRGESIDEVFEFLQPTIRFSADERTQLDKRGIVLRILPAKDHELAAVAAGALNVGSDALLASVRDIVDLKRSPLVPQIGRFSPQPTAQDLQSLTLDDVDVTAIKQCRPDDCDLKITPDEIRRLQQALAQNDGDGNASLNREFRRILVERVKNYLAHGDPEGGDEFSALLRHSPYVQAQVPQLGLHLESYPAHPLPDAESFVYWSKEEYGWKPMITATHVTILRGDGAQGRPELIVVSRDILATRYTSASFVLTLLFREPSSSQHYLVYVNRTWVDALRGLWRPFVEHRVKGQAKRVFADVRDRIERRGAPAISHR
jgi:hypothetical protein